MAEESRSAPREFQLETRHLAAIILIIAVLCITSFMLGRWVERQAIRATPEGQALAGGQASPSVEDVNKELTYFRTLEGDVPAPGVKAPPPEPREAPVIVNTPAPSANAAEASVGAPAPARREPPAGSAPDAREGVFIQVLATKDRSAATALQSRLAARRYRATVADGGDPSDPGWLRVRVGPFTSRAEAEKVAKRLAVEEKVRTWIP